MSNSQKLVLRVPRIKKICSDLGMSESDISTLINEEAIKRTKRLIQLFKDTSDPNRRRDIIALLHHSGDEEHAGNFFADLLESGNLRPITKFWVEVWGGFSKFKNHSRLNRVREAGLRGQTPATVLMNTMFPEGSACRIRKKRAPKDEQPRPLKRASPKMPAQILNFRKQQTDD